MPTLICKNPEFYFIHIPKNAGNSVYHSIISAKGADSFVQTSGTHSNVQAVAEMMGEDWVRKTPSFCIIRNPWARLWSFYNFTLQRAKERVKDAAEGKPVKKVLWNDNELIEDMESKGFSKWLVTNRLLDFANGTPFTRLPQTSWIKLNGKIVVQKMLKLEDMDWEFLRSLGIDSLPTLNVTIYNRNYREAYNQEAIDFVSHYFKEVIQYGNYSF